MSPKLRFVIKQHHFSALGHSGGQLLFHFSFCLTSTLKIIKSIESTKKTYFQQQNFCDGLTNEDTAFTIKRFYLFWHSDGTSLLSLVKHPSFLHCFDIIGIISPSLQKIMSLSFYQTLFRFLQSGKPYRRCNYLDQ